VYIRKGYTILLYRTYPCHVCTYVLTYVRTYVRVRARARASEAVLVSAKVLPRLPHYARARVRARMVLVALVWYARTARMCFNVNNQSKQMHLASTPTNGDKCHQICDIIWQLNKMAKNTFCLGKHASFNEGDIVMCSHFCPVQQYNKSKPDKLHVDSLYSQIPNITSSII